MMYAGEAEPVEVSVDGGAPLSEELVYGFGNFSNYSCVGQWINSLPSGRLCITGTTAPHYTRFGESTVDRCNASDEAETTSGGDCTVDTAVSILVRRQPDCTTADITAQGITMKGICGGTFNMGCTAAQQATGQCQADESPVHSVTLTKDFWMGRRRSPRGSGRR